MKQKIIIIVLGLLLGLASVFLLIQGIEISYLNGQTNTFTEAYATLSAQFNNVSGDLSKTTESLEKTVEELDAATLKNLSLKEKVAYYEKLLEVTKAELSEKTTRLQDTDDGLRQATLDLEDRALEIEELEQLIAGYEETIASMQNSSVSSVVLSESYTYLGTKWNLLENVGSSKSGSSLSTESIPVDSSYYYAIYSTGTATISCYSRDYALLETIKKDASEGIYLNFKDSCAFVKIKCTSSDDSPAYFVSTGISKANPSVPASNKAFYVVGGVECPVNFTLKKAVNQLMGGGTVLILPGTFNENISATAKRINLIGVDRDLCILRSTDMDYENPPLEIAAGSVKNLTIKAVNKSSKSTEKKAYAIHADYNYLADKTLTISNCIISSDFNAGIGMGLRRGTITISDCIISGSSNGIFFHDSDLKDFGGKQTLKISNCTIKATKSGNALAIHSQEIEKAEVNLIFINNTFEGSGPEDILTYENIKTGETSASGFLGLKGFKLDSSSKGNNIKELNK